MKKIWETIKDMSMFIIGIGLAVTWLFDKLANKKNKNTSKFETAGFISYIVALISSIIYLIS